MPRLPLAPRTGRSRSAGHYRPPRDAGEHWRGRLSRRSQREPRARAARRGECVSSSRAGCPRGAARRGRAPGARGAKRSLGRLLGRTRRAPPVAVRAPSARPNLQLAAALADRGAQGFWRAELAATDLAVDCEHRREGSPARRAARPHLAATGRAGGRQLGLVLLEVARCVPAGEAERDPIAESPATLLPKPVRGPTHAFSA